MSLSASEPGIRLHILMLLVKNLQRPHSSHLMESQGAIAGARWRTSIESSEIQVELCTWNCDGEHRPWASKRNLCARRTDLVEKAVTAEKAVGAEVHRCAGWRARGLTSYTGVGCNGIVTNTVAVEAIGAEASGIVDSLPVVLHDPQWVPGTDQIEMTLFDNDRDNCRDLPTYGAGRGIWIKLDYDEMSVSLVHEYLPPLGNFNVSAAYNTVSDAGSSKRSSNGDRTHVLYRGPVEIEGGMQLAKRQRPRRIRKQRRYQRRMAARSCSTRGRIMFTVSTCFRIARGPVVDCLTLGKVEQVWICRHHRLKKQEDTSSASGTDNPQVSEIVEVDDDVNIYFGSGSSVVMCNGLRGFFPLC
ncbi:hypothetical protein FISHEDRAFT_55269 [Fistulina hepatica ATCC 64428]|uniref:Uncharacterized protein n=1 Tax=Fistulina hepatica ATCC 64428 TaxID=1128425 RepID=A0A0D7APU0_9AGAR|nr:hypothetical protein FISHEDRAFT_55269 [Fistulina hepatica ATCC 64428]